MMNSTKTILTVVIIPVISFLSVTSCSKSEGQISNTKATDAANANQELPINHSAKLPDATQDIETSPAPQNTLSEYAIFTCQAGSEDPPAVHIDEIQDVESSKVTGIGVHLSQPKKIDLIVNGAEAVWDFKAISAHSGADSVDVVYDPKKNDAGYDWILNIQSPSTNFKTRVKNCLEVSAE